MSLRDVYIGQFEGRWRWPWTPRPPEGAPKRDSPFFPSSRASPYETVKRRIASGEYHGEQVDWGAWVARVSKAQLQALITEMYDQDPTFQPESPLPHLVPQLIELRSYVDRLADGEYALVASEL